MKAPQILAALVAVAGLTTVGVASASAATPSPTTCHNDTLGSGNYASVIVIGSCTVDGTAVVTGRVNERTKSTLTINPDATLKVRGNLILENRSTFRDSEGSTTHVTGNVTMGVNTSLGADSQDSTFKVDGNISALDGSVVLLGCTSAHPCNGTASPGAVGPFIQVPPLDSVTVAGTVTLQNPFNAAIDGATIGGLTSTGGGAGPLDPNVEFIPFSVKDDTILGDVTVTNLNTVWFGIIRSRVVGSVTISGIQNTDPDGNEIVANKITGDLSCTDDNPPAQYGDAVLEDPPFPGYGANRVGGVASGECAALTIPPSAA